MKSAIEVQDLHFSHSLEGSAVPILKGVNLKIDPGELVAIQGPSGSGKSTLLYLLGLLSKPNAGLIKILDRDVSSLTPDQLAQCRSENIGFIFQQFHLLPKTSVLDNILLPTQYSNRKRGTPEELKKKAIQYAELVGLGERLDHHPNQLSGGQQQRVAICRALMNDPEIILADEPTGNLDSQSAQQILALLKKLNQELKKTIVIITHDNEVAQQCGRIIHIKDGRIVGDENSSKMTTASNEHPIEKKIEFTREDWIYLFKSFKIHLPTALKNLSRNKTRTALTMIGIAVGVASVLSMITLGQFTKEKILAGYAELGVNTIMFYGYPNWNQRAIDRVPVPFQSFKWEQELLPLKKIFPEIKKISPVMSTRNAQANFGGKLLNEDVNIQGVSEEALIMTRRQLIMGRNFSLAEIEQRSGVCIIGYDVAKELFSNTHPIGQVLRVIQGDLSYGCRIIGVLASVSTNSQWRKPNLHIIVPFTYFQALASEWWNARIDEVMMQLNPKADVEKVGKGIRAFFEQRYGSSGRFRVDSDSLLVAQMRRFLILFTVLLSSVAFVTLAVGGVGITNMMLVSVSERFREIGLRKALGAKDKEIRTQFLTESILVCGLAGFIGLGIGFFGYHGAIWAATKFIEKMKFEWSIDVLAILLSTLSILLVGILSGIFPALKAEKLQVIEALRSE